jgi:hypothetical protein
VPRLPAIPSCPGLDRSYRESELEDWPGRSQPGRQQSGAGAGRSGDLGRRIWTRWPPLLERTRWIRVLGWAAAVLPVHQSAI